ncbi:A24 family peptidase [Meiothermus sp.]|uniref:prepilin peptidase n=1 Tax=Meiothermus sp. TaxID=1955249 RepID=UPI0021DEE40E|nr:A24 family peptidase [Meiothermus sp.]GIW25544.1 MAG: peptidase [Meiothermus sp.]
MDFFLLPLAVLSFVLGSLIGSFLNVVIYRLPAGISVVWPRSRCPHCGQVLSPIELVPIVSWVIQGGRCRNCKAPISVRYPAVEALTAVLFTVAALLRPVFPDLLFIWAFIALLVALSFIDIDTKTLPNSLNFAGIVLGLLGALLLGYPQAFPQALDGGLMGAGLIALFAGFGGLLYNRFKDGPREGPFGLHLVHLAAMVGAWGGMWGTVGGVWLGGLGIVVGLFNASLNARSGKVFALHDGLTLGLAALAPLLAWVLGLSPLESLRGMLVSAGGMALAGMLYWWLRNPSDKVEPETENPGGYVTVMGYGDVVLAGFLGVWLGFTSLMVAVFIAVLAGAIIGSVLRRRGGDNQIPFGPYLAIGGLIAFFYGKALVQWYLGYLGLA